METRTDPRLGYNIRQYIEYLATHDTTDALDDKAMRNIAKRLNFPNAVVVCGIVYLEGQGTPDFPPMGIQQTARMFQEVCAELEIKQSKTKKESEG